MKNFDKFEMLELTTEGIENGELKTEHPDWNKPQFTIKYETFGMENERKIQAIDEKDALAELKKLLKRKRLFDDFKLISITR